MQLPLREELRGLKPYGAPQLDVPVQLNVNENPYGPGEKALAAMTRAQAVASRYPDAAEEELAAAIARHHGVSREQIVLGCGSGEVLRMADAAFLSPGRTVVVAEPTFEAVLLYARVTKAEAVKVPLTADHRHDLPRMAAACDARTAIAYVCNPNNPTGTIVRADELRGFLEKLPPTAVALLDEAYHHFVDDEGYASAVPMIERFPNVVVTRTFSKIYGLAGMRLGYAVASKGNAQALQDHAAFSLVSEAALEAGLASLGDEAHLARERERFLAARRALCAELERDGRAYIASQANFVMIDMSRDVGPVIDAFRQRGILVGRRFPALPAFLRVTLGTPPEMAAFLSALREIVPARKAA